MGALLSKPLTEKDSECGEFKLGSRALSYAATGMQGWRMSMEDVRSVISELDEKTSLFAVYDGHGGKEVALYCGVHIPELLVSSSVYKSGNIPLALQKTFLECDRLLTTPEAVEEMNKLLLSDRKDQGEPELEDEDIDTYKLMKEANMPLKDLLGQYIGAKQLLGDHDDDGDDDDDDDDNDDDGDDNDDGDAGDVASMLKMLASRVGITIDFEDLEDSSEEENIEEQEKAEAYCAEEGGEEQEEEGEEQEEEGEEQEEEGEEQEEEGEEQEEEGEEQEEEEGLEEQEVEEQGVTGEQEEEKEGGEEQELEEDSGVFERKKESDDEKRAEPEEKYDSRRVDNRRVNKKTQKGTNKEINYTDKYHHHSLRRVAPHPNLAEEAVTNTYKQAASEGCSDAGKYSSGVHNGPCPNADVSHNNAHSTQLSDSLSSSNEEDLSDEEVLSNGVQTVERTLYKKNACLIDLLTSGVNHSHNNHMKTLEESTSVPGMSRKRKAPSTAEQLTAKKPCRLSADDIAGSMGIHSGTTAVVCLVRENKLIVANAGDSRCIISCKGECVDLSEDHKPTDAPELCRIKQAGGEVGADGRVNGGLNVSRALGDHFYKKNSCLPLAEQMITAMPDVRVRDISEEDEFIVLACDGIWNGKCCQLFISKGWLNVMSSQEAVDFVRVRLSEQLANGTLDLAKICEKLCDACLAPSSDNDGTGCDNMTCIIVLLQSPSEFLQNEL